MLDAANIVIALLVPFLSVWAAQTLVERSAKKRDAREIFLRVHIDVQDFRQSFLDRHPERLASLNAGVSGGNEVADTASRQVVGCVTALNGDCLVLGLVFDKKADGLGSRVQSLASKAKLLFCDKPPPALAVCQDGLNKDVQEIAQEMKALWRSAFGSP